VRVVLLEAPSGIGVDAAHELLRREVAQWLGCAAPTVVLGHRCSRCGSDGHGRPVVLAPAGDLHVSLSRAPGLVAVALTEAGPVGVDVEPAEAARFDGFDDVVLHPDEVAATSGERTQVWVRKEAVLKAVGTGLRLDPRRLRVSAAGAPAAVLGWELDEVGPPPTVWLADLAPGPGHRAAVAVRDMAVEDTAVEDGEDVVLTVVRVSRAAWAAGG